LIIRTNNLKAPFKINRFQFNTNQNKVNVSTPIRAIKGKSFKKITN